MTSWSHALRPSKLAVLLAAGSAPLGLLGLLWHQEAWILGFFYLAGLVFLSGLDAMRALRPKDFDITWQAPSLLYIGSQDPLTIRLSPKRPRHAEIHLLLDDQVLLQPTQTHTRSFDPLTGLTHSFDLRPLRRGQLRSGRLWLRWHGPLGLVRITLQGALPYDIPIVPNIRAVKQTAIRFSARDAAFGMKIQRQQGDGSEFDALRDYVPGLDHRSIDWKHSARHCNLVCKEFRTERNHNIILAFDCGNLMCEALEGVSRLDHAINAGLILAYQSLRQGDRVGLYAFDNRPRKIQEPVSGTTAMSQLQFATSQLDYSGEETNYALGLAELAGRLKRRSLIVLQTDFVDSVTAELMIDYLRHIARKHLVLFVTLRDRSLPALIEHTRHDFSDLTRGVIAADFLRERRVVLQRLRRMGIHCLETDRRSLGVELINRYLDIKRRELI